MFKKFLVLCAMLCCTALWGEEENDYISENKKASNLLSEVKRGMPIPDNIVEYAECVVENRLDLNRPDSCVEYAIFLSLYYLGFPEEILGKLKIDYHHKKNILPVADTKPLIKRGEARDLEKAKYYAKMTHISFWVNYYTGYAFPLDPEFAIFLLESIDSGVSKQILADIKAGIYD